MFLELMAFVLIEQMGDRNFRTREAAYRQLDEWNKACDLRAPIGFAASFHVDPEVRHRAKNLLDSYEMVPAAVKKGRFPRLDGYTEFADDPDFIELLRNLSGLYYRTGPEFTWPMALEMGGMEFTKILFFRSLSRQEMDLIVIRAFENERVGPALRPMNPE